MKPLRIVFMGSPDFAVPSLEKLHNSNHEIVSVISGEDKRRRRRGSPEPTPVKKCAQELGLTTFDAEDMKDAELKDYLGGLKADLFVVVAFKILPPSLLEIPNLGSVNLHASLLPKYRGAAPIHWAIIKGETETGCTVFFLEKKVDTGKIIRQKSTPIGPDETTGELYERLKHLGSDLIVESLDSIAEASYTVTPQDNDQSTSAPKLFKENTEIDFKQPAQDVHNFVRGLNPFPLAWCTYDGERMNLYKTAVGPQMDLRPGELQADERGVFAGTGDGTIQLLELQLPGRKRMSGREFANGFDLSKDLK
ncbi:methionyl-tRNA formyltransferase [Rhodohalobacter sp. 8-1]|uniref:methionyl-tRNA formyltransferase n=1 Tax=Rhodohalobacter sp. 8-1 TaxID=3131972 RepID=UPI0030EC4ED8